MRWLWIDRILELVPRQRLVAIKNVSLAEEHLHDHFAADGRGSVASRPALPVMPGSLIIEGMAQSGGILVGHAGGFRQKVVLAKINRAELTGDVFPGQTIRHTATIERLDEIGASTRGIVERLDPGSSAPAMRIGEIDMMFSHLDQNMAGMEFPEHNFVFNDAFRTLLEISGIKAGF
jgi:3-hydroxyacyl-[acyl-carrier-protein] dehydratase